MLNVHELTLNQFRNGALIPGNRTGKGEKEEDKERIHTVRHHAAEMAGDNSLSSRPGIIKRL